MPPRQRSRFRSRDALRALGMAVVDQIRRRPLSTLVAIAAVVMAWAWLLDETGERASTPCFVLRGLDGPAALLRYGHALLEPLPPNAVLLLDGSLGLRSARYAQRCDPSGPVRADVTILNAAALATPSTFNDLTAAALPTLRFPAGARLVYGERAGRGDPADLTVHNLADALVARQSPSQLAAWPDGGSGALCVEHELLSRRAVRRDIAAPASSAASRAADTITYGLCQLVVPAVIPRTASAAQRGRVKMASHRAMIKAAALFDVADPDNNFEKAGTDYRHIDLASFTYTKQAFASWWPWDNGARATTDPDYDDTSDLFHLLISLRLFDRLLDHVSSVSRVSHAYFFKMERRRPTLDFENAIWKSYATYIKDTKIIAPAFRDRQPFPTDVPWPDRVVVRRDLGSTTVPVRKGNVTELRNAIRLALNHL
jgi:hypothetical protein